MGLGYGLVVVNLLRGLEPSERVVCWFCLENVGAQRFLSVESSWDRVVGVVVVGTLKKIRFSLRGGGFWGYNRYNRDNIGK